MHALPLSKSIASLGPFWYITVQFLSGLCGGYDHLLLLPVSAYNVFALQQTQNLAPAVPAQMQDFS